MSAEQKRQAWIDAMIGVSVAAESYIAAKRGRKLYFKTLENKVLLWKKAAFEYFGK